MSAKLWFRNIGIAILLGATTLTIGTIGGHYIVGLPWLVALEEAAFLGFK